MKYFSVEQLIFIWWKKLTWSSSKILTEWICPPFLIFVLKSINCLMCTCLKIRNLFYFGTRTCARNDFCVCVCVFMCSRHHFEGLSMKCWACFAYWLSIALQISRWYFKGEIFQQGLFIGRSVFKGRSEEEVYVGLSVIMI